MRGRLSGPPMVAPKSFCRFTVGSGKHRAPGVELVVAQQLEKVSVQAVGSAFGHESDQGAGGVAVLGVERVGDHLELGDAVRPGALQVVVAGVVGGGEAGDHVLDPVGRSTPYLEIVERIAMRTWREEGERQDVAARVSLAER